MSARSSQVAIALAAALLAGGCGSVMTYRWQVHFDASSACAAQCANADDRARCIEACPDTRREPGYCSRSSSPRSGACVDDLRDHELESDGDCASAPSRLVNSTVRATVVGCRERDRRVGIAVGATLLVGLAVLLAVVGVEFWLAAATP